LDRLLPRLYTFAIILTAHEQLSRALVRAALRALPGRFRPKDGEDFFLDALKQTYDLWSAKAAETPDLRQSCPPEPRLFAGIPAQAAGVSAAHFAKFVAYLPPQQRAALYLVYGECLSYDEAAEIMGVDLVPLMKLLSRGHGALAHWLEHRGLDERALAGREQKSRQSASMPGQAA
jgi:RNA polymerase sigma-70 factor (ECF subfamily)